MSALRLAAVDLGRHQRPGDGLAGRRRRRRSHLEEVHRFPNGGGAGAAARCCWDVLGISPRGAGRAPRRSRAPAALDGIGIDSWAVDYGLLDATGGCSATRYSHRDRAHRRGAGEKVVAEVGAAELYAVTGLQQLPFNTIYQLVAALGTPAAARRPSTMLLLPDLLDLLAHRRGRGRAHQRLDHRAVRRADRRVGDWTWPSGSACPAAILPPLRDPGDRGRAGAAEVARHVGAGRRTR